MRILDIKDVHISKIFISLWMYLAYPKVSRISPVRKTVKWSKAFKTAFKKRQPLKNFTWSTLNAFPQILEKLLIKILVQKVAWNLLVQQKHPPEVFCKKRCS